RDLRFEWRLFYVGSLQLSLAGAQGLQVGLETTLLDRRYPAFLMPAKVHSRSKSMDFLELLCT
ncbi:mCG114716, partial [Mus musculus]